MTTNLATPTAAARSARAARGPRLAGLVAGPFFLASILLNSWASSDFLHRHGWELVGGSEVPWPSVLARGPYGWVQVATFALAGILVLDLAYGLRAALPRRRSARVGGWLVTSFGLAVLASSAPLDAAMVDGLEPTTWNGTVHGLAFLVAVASCVGGAVVLGFGLRGAPTWRPLAIASPAAGAAMVAALVFGPHGQATFIVFLAIAFGWIAALASRLPAGSAQTSAV